MPYQLLDLLLKRSLFSTPAALKVQDDKHGVSEAALRMSFVLRTLGSCLTVPVFPMFLGREAMVTLRREDGCRKRQR